MDINGDEPALTEDGTKLVATSRGSREEAVVLSKAVLTCPVVRQVAGDLLADTYSETAVADRIRILSGLSHSTAQRRAQTMSAWRHSVARWADGAGEAVAVVAETQEPKDLPNSVESGPSSSASFDPEVSLGASIPAVQDSVAAVPSASATTDPGDLLSPAHLAYLADQVLRGKLGLFTGAGFSMDARDGRGRPLLSGGQLAREIWKLSYLNDPYEEDSSLADLFFHASRRHAKELDELLRGRFSVDSASVPEHYAHWFSVPWRCVYTLNVDDLAEAAARRFKLPRVPTPRSAVDRSPSPSPRAEQFEIVHLNGRIVDGIGRVTFDVAQYSRRVADQEPAYALLAAELLAFPFGCGSIAAA